MDRDSVHIPPACILNPETPYGSKAPNFYLNPIITTIILAGKPQLAVEGGLAIAVPLELRGLALAHARHGSLPWATLLDPIIPLARDGFPAHPYLVTALSSNMTLSKCSHSPHLNPAWCYFIS